MSAVQLVRPEPDGPEPEKGASLQEPDPVWPALRGRRAHGMLRFHATAPQFQTAESGLCSRQEEKLYHAYFPIAATGLLRWVGTPFSVFAESGLSL